MGVENQRVCLKNPFLLDEGVVDLWVLTLNTHVLGVG